jgi:hypothetical protein
VGIGLLRTILIHFYKEIFEMPKPQLGKIMSVIKDPMVSDHFTLELPLITQVQGNAEIMLIQCQSAAKPGVTIDEVAVALFGHTIVYAGRKVFNHDLNVTYVENVRGEIHRNMEKWAELIRGTRTQHGRFKGGENNGGDGSGYAVNGIFKIYDNVGDTVLEYTLFNMWPATIPEISLDGTASNLITHAVGFKYDYYERTGGYTS